MDRHEAEDTLRTALEAIICRIEGKYDAPELLSFGPLSIDTLADCKVIAVRALIITWTGLSNTNNMGLNFFL